jgi:hypothetical protein
MQTFPDFMLNIVLAILAPLVTALVAALTFVVRDWHIRRDANGRKTRAIEQATKQVQFIDVWLSVYGKSSSPRQDDVLLARAIQDLEHAFRAVTDAASEPILERQGLGKGG